MDVRFSSEAIQNCIYNKSPTNQQNPPHAHLLLTNNAFPQAFLVRLGLWGRGGLVEGEFLL